MESLNTLFGGYSVIKRGKPLNERAMLIKFFVDEGFEDKKGKKLSPAYLGKRLAHYTVDDLYALKSSYTDRLNRNSKLQAVKYFWFITKTV